MNVIGSNVENPYSRNVKLIGSNSGCITHRAVKFACSNMGFLDSPQG